MGYVRVAGTGDLAPGAIKAVEAGGKKLLLANVDGVFRASASKCPHMGFNLCKGSLDGEAIVCPLHKAKFNLTSGEVERDPKLLFIRMTAKTGLKVFPVMVDGTDVLVDV